jgi:hypothetical protein
MCFYLKDSIQWKKSMVSSKYENLYPNCVFIKLQGELIAEEMTKNLTLPLTQQLKLKLTILFGQQYVKIGESIVLFGIKSGELKLNFRDSILLLETLGLTPSFKPTLDIEILKEKGTDKEGSGAFGFKTGIEGKIKKGRKSSKKHQEELCQVYAKGTTGGKTIEEKPSWVFQTKIEQTTLQGLLRKETLGILEINTKPCKVEATFNLKSKNDIHIFDLRPSKKKIKLDIQRAIEIFTQKRIYQRNTGLFSRAEVSYE